jgi:rare lipoprotein A
VATSANAVPPTVAPAAADAPAQAVALAPVAPTRGGYSVQLGAFANYANAQAFLAHAQNQLAAARVEARIRQAGGLYRVYVGPYTTRSEAERLSARITQAFGFPTTIAAH